MYHQCTVPGYAKNKLRNSYNIDACVAGRELVDNFIVQASIDAQVTAPHQQGLGSHDQRKNVLRGFVLRI